jgi:hypothetical protein
MWIVCLGVATFGFFIQLPIDERPLARVRVAAQQVLSRTRPFGLAAPACPPIIRP